MRWLLGVVAAGLLLAVGWSVSRPNYRELTLGDGTVVLGRLDGAFSRTASYYSVRLVDTGSGASLRSTARLHLRGHDFVLRDLGADDLRVLGVEARRPDHGSGDEESAFIGYGEQNRDGGLEFTFAHGRLRTFYAHCHTSRRCDFELSWWPETRFRLPIAEPDLRRVVGQPVTARDYWAK